METPLKSHATTSYSRYLLFAGIVLVAIVSVVLAVVLPKLSGDVRNQAWTSAACAGSVNVDLSTCNEGCSTDEHCSSGMICYKQSGATDGVCRNPQSPTNPACTSTTPPPATKPPTAPPTTQACVKSCTFNYDCSLPGETCVGTNANNTTASVVANSPRSATSSELSQLAPDQNIFMTFGTATSVDASGKVTFSVISRKSTTFTVYMYDITAQKGDLDPQQLVTSQTFSIGANQVVSGTMTLPHCGRYQIDFGSPIVTGTDYEVNSIGHYFWGGIYEIPCQNGCCVATQTSAGNTAIRPATNQSSLSVMRLGLISNGSGAPFSGYETIKSGSTISSSVFANANIAAYSFPSVLPATVGSIKFEVNNGMITRVVNKAPFTLLQGSEAAQLAGLKGTFTVKATPYTGQNATGTAGTPVTVTFTIQ